MKRLFISMGLVLSVYILAAQNEVDALRYSQLNQTGSARYNAMGGAFGALGGDLSAMASNPAGVGVYRKSDFGFSLSCAWNTVGTDFNNTYSSTNSNSIKLSNIGFVVAQPSIGSGNWKYINYGFSYNLLADYNNEFEIYGRNTTSSILDWEAEKIDPNLNPQEAAKINSYVKADVVFYDSALNAYSNDFAYFNSYDLNQNHRFNSSGYAREFDFSVAANYNDVLYLGGTLGIQNILYNQHLIHSEESFSDSTWLDSFVSDDYLYSKGNGVNIKFGFIYKVNQMFRIGGAFHTPTWFGFVDEYRTDVTAIIDYPDGRRVNPGNAPSGYFEWNLAAPWRFITNTAFVFGKHAIVSAEYEYVGYQRMKMNDFNGSFTEQNKEIKNLYVAGHNIKIGAEYQIGMLRLRGGLNYLGSPYEKNSANSDASKLIYSCGMGIATGNFYFDMAYQYASSHEKYFMYNGQGSMSEISSTGNRMITTIGFRF